MSTSEDSSSGASGMAVQQVPGLSGGELREGYAENGDQRLHYVEAWSQPGAAAGMINYYRQVPVGVATLESAERRGGGRVHHHLGHTGHPAPQQKGA